MAFGGWEMPLSYPSGTIAEHLSCRSGAALFDVSHLGTVRVSGPEAFTKLQSEFTNDLTKVRPGRAQYTHSCNEAGGVEDDIIVWWLDDEVFDVMPNASNTERIRSVVAGIDTTESRAILAVQGPMARSRLAHVSHDAARVERFHVERVRISGVDCVVAGTGYTGEDGVEIAIPRDAAPRVAEQILAAGIGWAGLGARDTLRLEAGLPLHGHELGPTITSLEARLGWVLGWKKASFRGRDALWRQQQSGPSRLLCGITTTSRRPPRDGSPVLIDGQDVGVVTSGNFSPVLGCGIALAFLPAELAMIGQPVQLRVRDSSIDGEVVPTPFVRRIPGA